MSNTAKDKIKPSNYSDSGSDSEDDDFVPKDSGQPSLGEASTSGATGKRRSKARTEVDGDSESEDDGSDDEAKGAGVAAQSEEIDADELEALKRERAELVAAAGGEDHLGKRRRLAQATSTKITAGPAANDEANVLKAKAETEWAVMKDSDKASTPAGTLLITSAERTPKDGLRQEEMISIPHTYKFAGEVYTTTRLLPRSHPDAVKYLTQSAAASANSSSAPCPALSSTPATSTASASRPPPGPRRKKGSSLAALSAAATSKPTKLNTLEKSKLDWDQYKGNSAQLSQQELDELENQTRGGGKGLGDMKGYLERKDFLDRVKDRTGQP
ncbi:uncharacterized protein UHO2_04421 [Ustilago hordei]|uniref:SWR1-complex protein 5 n=1 Tax=Ustilago hordei TaxID=120017 RepID=I2FVE5_USTHO|nr:uncharacterized protein UHO2_04421 [Ustilago hordei]CCF50888.1 uncharacterized protein UHOR_06770 [Ustilago hordei]SYW84482.1 uncharacterized protein UHO2_04421 [Ustilago hordei]